MKEVDIFDIKYWEQYGIKNYDKINEYIRLAKELSHIDVSSYPYLEIHHIVPKSFDKSLESYRENIINIPARYHYDLHKILLDCFYDKYFRKARRAINCMCNRMKLDKDLVTGIDYETARIEYLGTISGENNSFYGHHHTDEARKAIHDSRMKPENIQSSINNLPRYDRKEDNPNFGSKRSYNQRVRMSEAKSGDKNPMKNRHAYNNGEINITVKDGDLVPDGFILGRLMVRLINKQDGKHKVTSVGSSTHNKLLKEGWIEDRRYRVEKNSNNI